MVFDPATPPKSPDAFLAWFKIQTSWSEPHSYNDPDVATPALHAWLLDMARKFVPMNGPLAPPDPDFYSPYLTDYSIGNAAIYAAFAWSVAQEAFDQVFALAAKHQVGFFDVSASPSDVWLPDGDLGLTRIFSVG
jgi:hypothetical protein